MYTVEKQVNGFKKDQYVVFTTEGHENDYRLYVVDYQYGDLKTGRTQIHTVAGESSILVDSSRLRLAHQREIHFMCRMFNDSYVEEV